MNAGSNEPELNLTPVHDYSQRFHFYQVRIT